MAFREVHVVEVREVIRLWLRGQGFRSIARMVRVDRKTVRRYLAAAERVGVDRTASPDQISDEVIGQILSDRPARPGGHGQIWALLDEHKEFIKKKLKAGCHLVKVAELVERKTKTPVPYTTLRRFARTELGHRKQTTTVRLADGKPGEELQVDFGKMGLLYDTQTKRNRTLHVLIFTASFSRHMFVWPMFSQALPDVIEAFEAAWKFFGGVFKVVIPDNVKTIVDQADPTNPKLNVAFLEYAQSRGFVIDATRAGHPKDKARVERTVPYVRGSWFKGEDFFGLPDARRRASQWCLGRAGQRVHGTTQMRPAEVFLAEEAPQLLPAPQTVYDVPIYAKPKVHKDFHVEIAKALYSVPYTLMGEYVEARADSSLVRITYKGKLIKVHPRMQPGKRSTDPADFPPEKTAYAMRDIEYLKKRAASHGKSVGAYAEAVLETPLPWTRMRQVYRLLGLVHRYNADRVEAACAKALELEVIDVNLIARMLERALETKDQAQTQPSGQVVDLRFVRPNAEFAIGAADGR